MVILFLPEPETEPPGLSHVTRMEKAEVGLAVRLAGARGNSTSCCVVTVITYNDRKIIILKHTNNNKVLTSLVAPAPASAWATTLTL